MTESTTAGADPFSIEVRIYYEDTDAGGVVYYANYMRYFERARTEWLRFLGVEQDQLMRERNIVFAVGGALAFGTGTT